MSSPSREYLDSLILSAQKTEAELVEAISVLSQDQLNWKPNATTWSVGEVVDHIITSNAAYFKQLNKVVPEARLAEKFEKDPPKSNWMGKDFIKRMQPNAKKVKTFEVFEPGSSDHSPEIVASFKENQEELARWIETCKGLDLNRIKVTSPLTRLVRFRLGDALNILVTHQARHTLQAKKLLILKGFPNP